MSTPDNYFESLAEKYKDDDDEEASPFELLYYPMTAELVTKINDARKSDERFSMAALCAYNFIALNAANLREGVSRPIDIDALTDFLGLAKVNVYRALAELEAFNLIEPRSKSNRWKYDLPYLARHTERMKNVGEKKKADKIEKKIQIVASVLNQQSFSSRIRAGLIKLFENKTSYENLYYEIEQLISRRLTDIEQVRLKQEFQKLTGQGT